jgi:hypothetical protein
MYFNTNDSQIINGDNQTVIGANQNRNDDIHNNNYESGFGKDELLEYNNVDVENADDDGKDDDEDYKKDDNKDDDNDENEKLTKKVTKMTKMLIRMKTTMRMSLMISCTILIIVDHHLNQRAPTIN